MKRIAVLVVVVLAACGGGEDVEQLAAPDPACTEAEPAVAEGLAEGLYEPVTDLMTIEYGISISYTHLLVGRTPDGVGVWAAGLEDGRMVGPVESIDPGAVAISEWGAAAQPGSPADQKRQEVIASAAYQRVLSCLL